MTATALVAITLSAVAVILRLGGSSWASDHQDAPRLLPPADLADVFAFMRPGSSARMVLAMTFHAGAGPSTPFDSGRAYVFRLVGHDPTTNAPDPSRVDVRVACRFSSPEFPPQSVVCNANGFSGFADVGVVDAGVPEGPLRIFAGRRADPAFGDVARLQATVSDQTLSFADAGTNTFAGQNVLALVVDVDVDAILLAGRDVAAGRPLLAVSAFTEALP